MPRLLSVYVVSPFSLFNTYFDTLQTAGTVNLTSKTPSDVSIVAVHVQTAKLPKTHESHTTSGCFGEIPALRRSNQLGKCVERRVGFGECANLPKTVRTRQFFGCVGQSTDVTRLHQSVSK